MPRYFAYVTADGQRRYENASWETARTHSGAPTGSDETGNNVATGAGLFGSTYTNYQSLHRFDTTPFPAGTLKEVRLSLTTTSFAADSPNSGKRLDFREHSWTAASENMVPASVLSTSTLLGSITISGIQSFQRIRSTTSLTTITRSTTYGLVGHHEDAITGTAPTGDDRLYTQTIELKAGSVDEAYLTAVEGEIVVFTTSGATQATAASQSWTVPTGVSSIVVEGWGCGASVTQNATGKEGGGGGGGYAKTTIAVVPGDIIYYQVAPSAAHTDDSTGTTGAITDTRPAIPTWANKNTNSETGAFMRAASGHYGSTTHGGAGGGTVTSGTFSNVNVGDVVFNGGDGALIQGGGGARGGGGGGGSAGATSAGTAGTVGSGGTGGAGGAGGTPDGGAGGKGGNDAVNGSNGAIPGGAGGGGGTNGGVAGVGARGEIIITYTVTADTTAPTITSSATVSNAENTTLAHSLTADETVTWTITGGVDQARFAVSGSTLTWAGNGTKDFETPDDSDLNNTYVVQVTATDAANNATNQTITVTVTDKTDEVFPTITSSATASVAENSTLSHSLTADEAVTWSIVGGADQSHFAISTSTLTWASNGTKDFETPGDADANNTYVVTVRATDGGGNATDQTITVTVTNVMDVPFSHHPLGTSGVVAATDKTSASSWSITTQTDATVPAGKLVVLTLGTDNISTTNATATNDHTGITWSYGTWTKAYEYNTDTGGVGSAATASIWYCITTAEVPASSTLTANFSAAVTAKVALADAFNIDGKKEVAVDAIKAGSSVGFAGVASMSLSGLSSREYLFIRSSTGEGTGDPWTTNTTGWSSFQKGTIATAGGGTAANLTTENEFSIATATSATSAPGGTLYTSDWAEALVAIYQVAPDTTAPTITSAANVSNTEGTTLSHSLTANETVTWTITGGADQARFELSGSTLQWLSNGTKNFEAPNDADLNNTYIVQVTATDGASNATNQTITVTVTDAADPTLNHYPVGEFGVIATQDKTSSTSWSLSTYSAAGYPATPAGKLVVLTLTTDNISATSGATTDHTGVTWSYGTWTKVHELSNDDSGGIGSSTAVSMWYCVTTAEVPPGSALTANFSAAVTAKVAIADAFTFNTANSIAVHATKATSNIANGNVASMSLSALTSREYLFVRTSGGEGGGDPWTTNTTGWNGFQRGYLATSGGATTTNVTSETEFTIKTDTGATSAPGGTLYPSSWAEILAAFYEVDTTAPSITSSASVSVAENTKLAHSLTANETVTWSIGSSPDAHHFEISGSTLRWLHDGAKDFDAPEDFDTNNVYAVVVQAEDGAGNTTQQTINVTVTDVAGDIYTAANTAGTVTNVDVVGNPSWTANGAASLQAAVATSGDATNATTTVGDGLGTEGTSDYLEFTGFGFAIPAGSTINTVEVSLSRKGGLISSQLIQLVYNGAVIANTNVTDTTSWSASYVTKKYTIVNSPSVASVNHSSFGFRLQVTGDSNADIDYATVRVNYDAPPTITSSATVSVAENSTLSHGLTADETVTWAIRTSAQDAASVDHTHFELSGATLRWLSDGTKDFEAPNDADTNNTYVVVVRATDGAGKFTDQTVTVTVTDVVEVVLDVTAPTITSSATGSVAENTTLAHSLTADETVTWSIRTAAQNAASVDHARFELSGSTLRWLSNGTKDFEAPDDADTNNTYVVVVRATDGASNFSEQTVTITVTDVDDTAPTITSASAINHAENTAFSHTLTANETVTWTKTGGADSALFTLSGATLSMTAKDFEAPVDSDANNTYVVQVTATDAANNATNQTITVTITDVDDTAPTITSSSAINNVENTTLAHGLTANETVTWTISGGADQTKFALSGSTLTWAANGTKNFEAPDDADLNNTYVVQVTATDGASNATNQTITVTVTDADEVAPTITSSASVSVPENSTLSHSLTANETVTWAIRTSAQDAASVDHTHFELSGSTLRWLSNGTKNFEAPGDADTNNTYIVVLRATDAASNFTDQTVTVTVTDVDEIAPTITSASTFNHPEGSPFSQTLTANETVTWTKTGGADAALFTLAGDVLQMSSKLFDAPADSDANNTYIVQVTATDAANNATNQTITVNILAAAKVPRLFVMGMN